MCAYLRRVVTVVIADILVQCVVKIRECIRCVVVEIREQSSEVT
jgi:hypothetical protein